MHISNCFVIAYNIQIVILYFKDRDHSITIFFILPNYLIEPDG